MLISRRQFLKYCTVAAGALGLTSTDLLKLEKAFANESGANVVWVNGQSCTGCTVSLANSMYYTTVQDLLINTIDLNFSETLMAAQGVSATQHSDLTSAPFVLALEGAIPTGDHFCDIGSWAVTSSEQVKDVVDALATNANCVAVLAIGTCASYGGIPGANGNVTGAKGLLKSADGGAGFFTTSTLKKKLICIPGCPPNPNWIVGTVAYLLTHGLKFPSLDSLRRPRTYYGERLCNNCDRFSNSVSPSKLFIDNKKPYELGDKTKNKVNGYCLKKVGCKGSRAKADCSLRKWHSAAYATNGVNWCVGAGAPCQGCTQVNWPDRFSPFHYLP